MKGHLPVWSAGVPLSCCISGQFFASQSPAHPAENAARILQRKILQLQRYLRTWIMRTDFWFDKLSMQGEVAMGFEK